MMFMLLSAFTRALAHKLRTPLSVLSNDLSYFKSKLGVEECEASERKCEEIAQILREITSVGGVQLDLKLLTVTELLRALDIQGVCDTDNALRVSIDLERWKVCMGFIQSVLNELSGKQTSCVPKLTTKLDFTWDLEVPESPASDLDLPAELDSLTEFVNVYCASDSPFPPLVDAIVWGHAGRISVRCTRSVHVELSLLYCE